MPALHLCPRPWPIAGRLVALLGLLLLVFGATEANESQLCVDGSVSESDPDNCPSHFSSQLGSIIPESLLPPNKSVALVKVASRLIGRHAWPVKDKLFESLNIVSGQLSEALKAKCTTEVFPTPLAFASVRGLGLKEATHIADAPCAVECTKRVYPDQEDFTACKSCSQEYNHFKEKAHLAGIEILLTLNYSRSSQLLGATQSSMANTFVKLLKDQGTEVQMIGSTYRLTAAAEDFVKYLPLDTLSFRYRAWEVHVQFSGPNIVPFAVEKENLILAHWQSQQPGQDFRIKEVKVLSDTQVELRFVTNHIPVEQSDKLAQLWRDKADWFSQQLNQTGLPGTTVKVLNAHEVYDETLADQFRILAGKPRGPVSFWDRPWHLFAIISTILAVAASFGCSRKGVKLASSTFPMMQQFASTPGDRHTLVKVPLRMGGEIDVVDITILQRPDGSDWLLGSGSSGKVFKGVKNGVQPVAVKVLNHSDEVQLDRFGKEIALLRSLSFDGNIVQFYGACLQRENTMMVLEFMAGGDLMQAIGSDRQNKLRWSRKGHALALDIAKGLVHLHANKVIHMDMKTKNILLNRDHTVAKITDVGLSRGLQSSISNASAGTLEYSAPEVLLGRFCDTKADIYSFGVVLWEIVTHEQPCRGDIRDCKVPQECPAEIDKLIDSCLNHDPAQRPTAREICDVIKGWQQSTMAKIRETRQAEDMTGS